MSTGSTSNLITLYHPLRGKVRHLENTSIRGKGTSIVLTSVTTHTTLIHGMSDLRIGKTLKQGTNIIKAQSQEPKHLLLPQIEKQRQTDNSSTRIGLDQLPLLETPLLLLLTTAGNHQTHTQIPLLYNLFNL
jgi:hypothetical protein